MSSQASEKETSSDLLWNAVNAIHSYLQKLLRLLKPKRICIVLLLVAFALFYSLNPLLWFGLSEKIDSPDHHGLILNTPGCKIPKFDPYDESLKHLLENKKPYVCTGDPVFMIVFPNRTIILNDTVLTKFYKLSPKDVSCYYKSINRITPTDKKTREVDYSFGKPTPLTFGVALLEEFIKVECKLGSKNFIQYIALVPIKPEVEERASKLEESNQNLLNVILIGIDSISKLNFLRNFNKTRRFLTTNVSSLEMNGYTKVGDNTFPNLIPMLTGHFVDHYWNESLKDKMFFDNLDLIWKVYSKKGYRTFYAEDMPMFGTFQYLKRGFKNPPTDYYYRPMALALHKSDLQKKSKAHCLNDQLEVDMIYGYLKDFVSTMKNRSYFAFAMVSTLTHNYLNYASYADEPTVKLLEHLLKSGAMNRSLTILFSDHGIRFGKIRETYIGKFEERMPFMYLMFPQWFLNEHENFSKALKINQNRLVTLFDIHATLYHLLNFTKPIPNDLRANITPNGLSLLNEISEYRTCEMANILPHWCPCQVYEYVTPNDKVAMRAAAALISDINNQLEPYIIENICAQLEIEEVVDARFSRANDIVLRYVQHKNDVLNRYILYGDKVKSLNDYLITLRARPGGGMFEGTVRYNMKTGTLEVLGVSRINMYGKQSWCINSQILKKFCFCP